MVVKPERREARKSLTDHQVFDHTLPIFFLDFTILLKPNSFSDYLIAVEKDIEDIH
jgi:hypothetical protein